MAEQGDQKFTWVIKNPSSLQSFDFESDRFEIGGCKWYLASCPNSDQDLNITLVLEYGPSLTFVWRRHVRYRLTIENQHSEELLVVKDGLHWFDASTCKGIISGSLLPISKLHDRDDGLIVNGELKLVAKLKVKEFVCPLEFSKLIEEARAESSDDYDYNDDDACKEWLDGGDKSEDGLDHDNAASEENPDNDMARDVSSLNQVKYLEDTLQIVENGGTEIEPVKETMEVSGFEVSSSQELEMVSHIFKSHPEVALGFRPKNQRIRRAYMNELLSLIETLCQSPEKLSEDDLSNADKTLGDLMDVGFELDWLKTKLNDVAEKKKKERSSMARIHTMEEQLQKLKLTFLDLETQLHKEKEEVLAARVPLSFSDVVS